MKVSELIEKLQKLKEEHGDVECKDRQTEDTLGPPEFYKLYNFVVL